MKKYVIAALGVLAGNVLAASHLDQISHSKQLTVCATGDYSPYTLRRTDGRWEGIDVEMMTRLASSLGAQVNWVKSSWKTLLSDFQTKQCDIATGGISVTLMRQRSVWFARPLGTDGKIPLVRCEDSARYQTIAQLNRPQVRLIEPAGGTNEAFVRHFLPQAHLTLFHDNVTLFQQLVDKKADVIITDASEARYQSARLPQLCALNPTHPLQYGEKAYMLPPDDMHWKLYVDQWLHLSTASGEYAQIVSHWLAQK
ncbi:transporter substrate-binding domain-containing protein [Enterobacteriaceae bacterium LUAb1]